MNLPHSNGHSKPLTDGENLLFHALAYARRGWSIIPVAGKKSIGIWKPFQTRAADAKTLIHLFAKRGVTGLAVILGKSSGGLAVRDFDTPEAYFAWRDANPEDAARLPTVQTARGYHVYGQLTEEAFAILECGELRADSGHYVLLPPSIHPDGGVYRWINPLPDLDQPSSRCWGHSCAA
jgi:Bifunctional DNA primase/polymerase, N-terminal